MGASQRGQVQESGMSHSDRRLIGADLFTITLFVVRDEFFVSPVLTEIRDQRECINLELLIFGRVGIIEGPLLERDISADKI